MATVFTLAPKNYFLDGEDLNVTLSIISDDGTKATLAVIDPLTEATHTANGTLEPTSQVFDAIKQEVRFTIPVYLPNQKSLNYIFKGGSNIDGYKVEFQTSVTVDPITVTVTELFAEDQKLKFVITTERSDTATPIETQPEVSVSEFSYQQGSGDLVITSHDPVKGETHCELTMTNPPVRDMELFVLGSVFFQFDQYGRTIKFSRRERKSQVWEQYPEPLVNYAVKNMWGNRELDSQYQLKLSRITPKSGWVGIFFSGGKSWRLPREDKFFHIYSMGGLSANFWNFFNQRMDWYPFNTWVRASEISHDRNVDIIPYTSGGRVFLRDETFIMNTFDGNTFVAFPAFSSFPIPAEENMYIRCYSSDINTANISQGNQDKWRFGYASREYLQSTDWDYIKQRFNTFLAFGMGEVSLLVNGVTRDRSKYVPKAGDLMEVRYDPTINQVIRYNYSSLNDFYSELDKKRKLLLFPALTGKPRMYRYFDDCEFSVRNKRTGDELYYHRNKSDAIRQLTHQDYSISATYVQFLIGQLLAIEGTGVSTENDIEIVVLYRATKWQFKLGPNVSRINDLYLLENPAKILAAMVGTNATVKEWSAPELEASAANIVLNGIFQELNTETVRNALGYNGCSVALSSSPFYMPYLVPGTPGHDDSIETPPYETGLGYRVPPTYVESSTAYEYDKDGLFLRRTYLQQREFFTPGEGGWYVEYVLGKSTTWLDYIVSRQDVVLKKGYGFRVYKAGWIIDPDQPNPEKENLFANEFELTSDGFDKYPVPTEVKVYRDGESGSSDPSIVARGGKPDGKWVDITGTNEYRIENGVLIWNFDVGNQVGMVLFDSSHLFNEFELEHLDNSIFLTLTHTWDIGGVPLTIQPAQVDVWCNNHPLIENVDYYMDFPNIYVVSKMWLKDDGKNKFAYRCRGLHKDGLVPSSELGFVQSGCIGYNGRYNLRIDRPTRTIVNGRLFLTEHVDWAETLGHGNNMLPYNGMPYEVKHIYCANRYVDMNDLYWGFEESRDLDRRVGAYLTEFVDYKPEIDPQHPYMETDRYRLFSPLLSQLVNEMVLGFLKVPPRDNTEIGYTDQLVDEITQSYQWLLAYDPIKKGMDPRFFSFHPYVNANKPTLTPDQLTLIGRVNDLYLGGVIKIEGFFEVSNNV